MKGLYIAAAAATAVNAALITASMYSRGNHMLNPEMAFYGVATAVSADVVGIAPFLAATAVANALR